MRKNGIEYLRLSAGPTLGLRNEVTKCKELLWGFVNSSYCIGDFFKCTKGANNWLRNLQAIFCDQNKASVGGAPPKS